MDVCGDGHVFTNVCRGQKRSLDSVKVGVIRVVNLLTRVLRNEFAFSARVASILAEPSLQLLQDYFYKY